jgi:hypothetical protein
VSISLILVTLGAGLGFSFVSPFPEHGVSATTFTVTGAIWLIVTQWLSAATGGYLAGRLRHRWLATHGHEVFFRDTAHGLATWSVATLVITAVLAGSIGGIASGGARAVAGGLGAGAEGMMHAGMQRGSQSPMEGMGPAGAYDVDKLFRSVGSTSIDSAPRGNDARMEVLHIVAREAGSEQVEGADRAYLINLVSAKAGVSPEEAQQRVDVFLQSVKDAEAKVRATADAARKSAAHIALYTALSLLMGAFIASVAAAIGGHLRDEHT